MLFWVSATCSATWSSRTAGRVSCAAAGCTVAAISVKQARIAFIEWIVPSRATSNQAGEIPYWQTAPFGSDILAPVDRDARLAVDRVDHHHQAAPALLARRIHLVGRQALGEPRGIGLAARPAEDLGGLWLGH